MIFFEFWENVKEIEVTGVPNRFTVCITKQGYVPKLFTVQVIQGTALNSSPLQSADVFIIGNKISDALPAGDVDISGADIIIKAGEIILTPGVNVKSESDLEIINM